MKDEIKWAVLRVVIELLDDPSVKVEIDNKIKPDWGPCGRPHIFDISIPPRKPSVVSNGTKITIESFTVKKL